jgi:hypothetical protein
MVAMSGSIMPAPFAIPTIEPPPTGGPADLGIEVGGHDPLGRRQHGAAGERAHGRREGPEDRVDGKAPADDAGRAREDLGRGEPEQARPSAQTRSAAPTPPGAHTLEILLLTMIAASDGSPSLRGRRSPGAPGNAFLVKTAAKVRRGPVERDQRQRHPRRLGRLGGREVEARRPDAESRPGSADCRPRARRGATRGRRRPSAVLDMKIENCGARAAE